METMMAQSYQNLIENLSIFYRQQNDNKSGAETLLKTY